MKDFVAIAAGLLLVTTAQAAVPLPMHGDPAWPKPLPNGWALGEVAGIATDSRDHVWIIQRPHAVPAGGKPAPPIIEFDPDGTVVQAWGGPGTGYDWVTSEHGIDIDPNGFVWVGGNGAHDGQVLKFTRDGKFVLQIGRPGAKLDSNDNTKLGRPAETSVDADAHEVYVADGYGNHRVVVFDSDTGAYKRHWGAYGKPPTDRRLFYDPKAAAASQFGNPVHCVKLARDGLVYVCDRQNDRIQVFHHDGRFVAEFFVATDTRGLGSVWDLAFWPDTAQTLLFAVDGTANTVHLLRRSDGTIVGAFGRAGRAPGQFHWVHSLAVDSRGNVFTTEVDIARRVQKFVPAERPSR
jgi:DNA-binding beta-propeller fold protein YncE